MKVIPDILILTRSEDFHAFAVSDALDERGLSAAVIETDRLVASGGVSWDLQAPSSATLPDARGRPVQVSAARLVWWRRFTGEPAIPEHVDGQARAFVARECRASLLGLVATESRARYISDPEATRAASNKLVQLRVAQQAGLRVPRTLVSSDPVAVRDFCTELGWEVIVKTVGGAGPRQPLMTGRLRPELLPAAAVELCPAIYQELIPGDRHLRVNVFGDRAYAAELRSNRLDWRYPLDCDAAPAVLDPATKDQLLRVLDMLGLRMGIFDLKLTPGGEVVWLEINPQGQFLWLEGLTGMPLLAAFTDYLTSQLEHQRSLS
ncbi:RimK family alpha-L-glutamate ligase [Ornithinimicrobium sp. LYQ103]|uniref:ATP-grasp domain-containing protein n=1 Tax=Ornithinimicrobium sp. LYQ103 TaxID=3378796 RepID=UPI00385310B9